MAEEKNVTVNEEKAPKYEIEIEGNEPFDYIEEAIYTTSNDLCAKVSEIFKELYADCYGASFDVVPGTNIFAISLYFDHLDHAEGEVVAVSKNVGSNNTKNSTLRKTRTFWSNLQEGDRYHVTEAGEQIGKFLYSSSEIRKSLYENNGKPKWAAICAEVANPGIGMQQQLTKISYINPRKIVEAIYGSKTAEGDQLEYTVEMKRSVPSYSNGAASANYILHVGRVKQRNIMELAAKCGIQFQQGLNIIR